MFNFALSLNKWRDHPTPQKHSRTTPKNSPKIASNHSVKNAQKDALNLAPLLALSHDYAIIASIEGDLSFVSDSLYSALDLDAVQKDKLTFLKIFHEQDRPYIRSTIQSAMLEAETMSAPTLDFKARLATRSKQELWAHWKITEQDGLTYCLGQDITQSQGSQNELAMIKEQLIEAENIGRFGRWQWTIGQEAFSWSDEVYSIFGLTPEEFTPSIDTVYAMLHEDDQDRMDQTFQRAVINQNPFDIDFCITQPNGEERFIRCEGRCRADDQGEIITLYGIMQDMSERISYENELRRAKEAAEKACAARTQFLANMSHELRTPLNAIIGFSEMIEGQMFGAVGHEKYSEYASHIRESGAHLLDLISDILDMSKIEAGKYDLELEAVKFNDILDSALTMIRPRADEKHIKINQNSHFRSDMILNLDRRASLQIVLNILSNAVKFTADKGQITLQCEEHKNSITLSIRDNGIGIPATKLASITNPFEQVSSHYTRDHEGSGLGLAITKELIELHGGTLKIKSQIDVGTDVMITFPLHNAL